MNESTVTALNDTEAANASRALHGLPAEAVCRLVAQCTLVEIQPGEQLLGPARPNDRLYIVLAGELTIHVNGVATDPINVVGPGMLLGEISLIDGSPPSAYAVARAPSRLLALERDQAWRLVEESHPFAISLLKVMSGLIRRSTEMVGQARNYFDWIG